MLLTGEVYRAVKPKTLHRKQRELQKKLLQPLRSIDAVVTPPMGQQERTKRNRGALETGVRHL